MKLSSMKKPQWLSHLITFTGNEGTLTLTRKQWKLAGIGLAIVIILALVMTIWGVARQAEITQLRQQNQLQTEQLKLLQKKTDALDKKLQTLDQLDQEIRNMVKGSEQGKPAQGGGESEDPKSPSSDDMDDVELTPTQMSAKLTRMDAQIQRRLASFYMLRSILKDGAGADIVAMQSVNFNTSLTGSNTRTPSIWPSSGVITSEFGSRVDPVYGGQGNHEGIDIADDYGTQIVATAAGTVSFAGFTDGGYGNLVEIDHGNGIITKYGHASAVLVNPGDQVTQGQVIALMGSTGKSTGSHVHYEVDVNGTAVDPIVFLPVKN